MTRFFLLIAIATAGYLIYRLYFRQLLKQGKSGKIQIGLIALGLIFIAMAAMLKAPAFFALIGAAMTQVMRAAPLLIKYAPWLANTLGMKIPGLRQSTIKTTNLLFTIDSQSGKLGGTVLDGEYTGRHLDELDNASLSALFEHCKVSDPEAAQLLNTYLVRERGGESGTDSNSYPAQEHSDLTMREACDILGVKNDANKQAIEQAYRLLMRQFHPDKGGSNYLAAKVNAAKELLLKNSRNSKS